MQTAQAKINKNDRDLYLVKEVKNTKAKKKVFVQTKAINLKKKYIRNSVDKNK